jgi:hypothetical protein
MTRRPWTARDQITAEVAAACGISWTQIGQILGRAGQVVKRRVDLAAAKKHEKAVQQWRKANPEKWQQIRRRSYEKTYELNREKILERNRQWRAANLGKVEEKDRRYYLANREKLKAKSRHWRRNNYKKYYKVNREIILEKARQWREANIEKVRETGRRYYQANIEKRIEESRRRKAFKRTMRAKALSPLTIAGKDARFALWRNHCAFCGVDPKHPRNHGYKRLTVDHLLALVSHGLDESTNIVPACSTCNSSKNAKPVEAWYRRQPFFTEARWCKICRHCPGAVIGQLPLALPPADAEAA